LFGASSFRLFSARPSKLSAMTKYLKRLFVKTLVIASTLRKDVSSTGILNSNAGFLVASESNVSNVLIMVIAFLGENFRESRIACASGNSTVGGSLSNTSSSSIENRRPLASDKPATPALSSSSEKRLNFPSLLK